MIITVPIKFQIVSFRKLILIVLIAIVPILFAGCLLQPVQHEGTSMKPAIGNGDRIFVNRIIGELKRGDIVVFQFPEDKSKSFVKRIIGLPNEKIEIRSGKVFINNQSLEEPYIDSKYNQVSRDSIEFRIPDGHYFVLGDNRNNSYDSRSWGTLPKELIYGVYYTTYLKGEK